MKNGGEMNSHNHSSNGKHDMDNEKKQEDHSDHHRILQSSAVVFGLKGKFFFWEFATLIDVMLLGHWIEMRSVMGDPEPWRSWHN